MLKCASVFTYEIDDQVEALNEIKKQLDEQLTFLKNTVGIIMCHPEFITSGTLRYICENLTFEVAGVTTSSQAVRGEAGELILTMLIMTSDDVSFKVGVTESFSKDAAAPVKAAYEKASAGETGHPGLAIIFPPLMLGDLSGDAFLTSWKELLPKTPIFGQIAMDDTVSFADSEVIHNGINYKKALSFILFYGNINPRFLVATLHENSEVSLDAEITKAKDNIVYEIDNINTREFFMSHLGGQESMLTFPLKISSPASDDDDGIPVVREQPFYAADGAGIFSGTVEEGAKISLLKFDKDSILSKSKAKIEKINELPDANGALLLSCIARRIVLVGTGDHLTELNIAKDTIKDIPFMMGYAGGEICPTSIRDGIPFNRFHNNSVVILVI